VYLPNGSCFLRIELNLSRLIIIFPVIHLPVDCQQFPLYHNYEEFLT
jgi:hypothetical protein